MDHIHTGPGQHDLTVSAYIIRADGDEPTLFLRKSKKDDIWEQFTAHVELDKNPWQAVAEDLAKSSGYALDELKLLQPVTRVKKLNGDLHPQPFCVNTYKLGEAHYHTDLAFAFVAREDPKNSGADEVNDFSMTALSTEESEADMLALGTFIIDELFGEWVETNCPSASLQ